MAFGTQKRSRGFASGGTVDVTITPPSGSIATTPPATAANSPVPAPSGVTPPALAAGAAAASPVPPPTSLSGGLGAATPTTQPAFAPQPYSSAVASVPVGGTTGAASSPYATPIGPTGMPQSMPNSSVVANPGLNGIVPGTPSAPNAIANPIAPDLKRGGMANPHMQGRHLAGGGIPTSEALSPWYARMADRQMLQPEGLIKSMGAGRTDIHNINVPAGSYVLPADIVSGLGEGNTLAGSAVVDRMMHSNPYGIQTNRSGARSTIPRPPPAMKDTPALPTSITGPLNNRGGQIRRAEGGGTQQAPQGHGEPVPIVIAGGEFLIHPQTIVKKFGSLKHGHKVLDKFVVNVRQATAKKMLKLPGPKK